MMATFNTAKTLFSTAELSHPSLIEKLVLIAKTSGSHVETVIHQQHHPGSPWEPIGFFSEAGPRSVGWDDFALFLEFHEKSWVCGSPRYMYNMGNYQLFLFWFKNQ